MHLNSFLFLFLPSKLQSWPTLGLLNGKSAVLSLLLFTNVTLSLSVCAVSAAPKETSQKSILASSSESEKRGYSQVASFAELILGQKVYAGARGTPLSFGSGLSILSNSAGKSVLFGLSDRGPNILTPKDLNRPTTYLLLEPDFAPSIVPFLLDGDQMTPVTWSRLLENLGRGQDAPVETYAQYASPLLNSSGEKYDGIPPTTSGQLSVTPDLSEISPSGRGIDPEGITILPELNQIWVSEEYGPSILVFDLSTRKLLKRLDPGHGLPDIVSKRKMNRGFEGIASFADGTVVTALQSPLSVDGMEEDCLRFVVINRDGSTESVGMSLGANNQFKDYKLSDLAAVEKNVLIGLESYEDSNEKKFKNLIAITLSSVEKDHSVSCTSHNSSFCAKREKILDMAMFGRNFGKLEGITLLPDKKSLLFTEDTDFGVNLKKKGKKKSDISIPGSSEFLSIKDEQTKVYRITFYEEISKLLKSTK